MQFPAADLSSTLLESHKVSLPLLPLDQPSKE